MNSSDWLGRVFFGLMTCIVTLCVQAQVNIYDDGFEIKKRLLNDTGINWCADGSTSEIACPVVGYEDQDGDFGRDALARTGQLHKVGAGAAGFDYSKLDANGNDLPANATNWACVRDNRTRLIWEVKTDDNGLRDRDNSYTWWNRDSPPGNGGEPGVQHGGICFDSRCDTSGFAEAVNAQGLCGAQDWRVPAVNELLSISNLGSFFRIDLEYFPNTPAPVFHTRFWSASTSADSPGFAWTVLGGASRHGKSNAFRVRLVRGVH